MPYNLGATPPDMEVAFCLARFANAKSTLLGQTPAITYTVMRYDDSGRILNWMLDGQGNVVIDEALDDSSTVLQLTVQEFALYLMKVYGNEFREYLAAHRDITFRVVNEASDSKL
jgi:hypothetical protein